MRDRPFPEALSALRDFLSVRPTRRARQEGLPVTTTSPRSRDCQQSEDFDDPSRTHDVTLSSPVPAGITAVASRSRGF